MNKAIEVSAADLLLESLKANGFKIAEETLRNPDNLATWYAYRRSEIPAVECECNDGKRMQIVIKPHFYNYGNVKAESVEVDVTGEAGGVWYKLCAYSLPAEQLMPRLPKIEASLLAAWNALVRG